MFVIKYNTTRYDTIQYNTRIYRCILCISIQGNTREYVTIFTVDITTSQSRDYVGVETSNGNVGTAASRWDIQQTRRTRSRFGTVASHSPRFVFVFAKTKKRRLVKWHNFKLQMLMMNKLPVVKYISQKNVSTSTRVKRVKMDSKPNRVRLRRKQYDTGVSNKYTEFNEKHEESSVENQNQSSSIGEVNVNVTTKLEEKQHKKDTNKSYHKLDNKKIRIRRKQRDVKLTEGTVNQYDYEYDYDYDYDYNKEVRINVHISIFT